VKHASLWVPRDHLLPAFAVGLLCRIAGCRYSKLMGRELNWESEVTVGVGSSECLFAIMQSLVEEGDEVILISPGAWNAVDTCCAHRTAKGCCASPHRTVEGCCARAA